MSYHQDPSQSPPKDEKRAANGTATGASPQSSPDLEELRLDPGKTPILLSTSRATLSALRDLELLAKAETEHGDGKELAKRALEGWKGHPYLAMELQSIRDSLGGGDLDDLLVERLMNTTGIDESLATLKLCGSADAHAAIMNGFVVPYLEKRPQLPDPDGNESFAGFLLGSLSEEDLRYAMSCLDLSRITDNNETMKKLAAGLLGAAAPEPVMDSVIGRSATDTEAQEGEGTDKARELGQKLAVCLLGELSQRAPKLLEDAFVPHIEALYRNAHDSVIARSAVDVLTKHNWKAALRVLEDVYSAEARNDEDRAKRFFAVGHLSVTHTPNYAPKRFEEMVLAEADPYVCGNIAYILAHETGPEGRQRLASAIVKQISEDEISYPLAAISSLAAVGYDYRDVMKAVLSSELDEGSVRRAFSNLYGEELSRASKSDKGTTFFKQDLKENPDLPADLLSGLGMSTVLEWTMGKSSILRRNARELLDTAFRLTPERSRGLLLRAVAEPGAAGVRAREALETLAGLQY